MASRSRKQPYFVPGHKTHEPPIDHDALIRLSPDEDVVLGYNNAHLGYLHWLIQCVPAFDWSLRQKRDRPMRLLMSALQPWQEDCLRILGHHEVPRLMPEPGKQYFLPRAEFSEFLNGSTAFSVSLSMLDTARRMLAALPSEPSPHKVLYVPCANPYYGSLANAAEVEAILQRHGVYIVDQKHLDTAVRINLFRHADLVIGPHGQGLSDSLFSKPGTVLWEWMPRHLQHAGINRLAQAAKVHYHSDLFESIDDPNPCRPWAIDIARMTHGLSERLNDLARPVAYSAATQADPIPASTKPVDELMLRFESLGGNCEFGLVQRYVGIEPLGLLRYADANSPKIYNPVKKYLCGTRHSRPNLVTFCRC
jgi:capsular polysaccharide biosynthesis protein